MGSTETWDLALAIITSLGGGSAIVFGLSTFLGKVWAGRILEKDKLKYQSEMESIKSELNKKIHEHNVAISRVDSQRAEAVRELYVSLLEWFEAALQIRAPNNLQNKDLEVAIPTYQEWATKLRAESEKIEKLAMLNAIFISDETYGKFAHCGVQASQMSINFCDAVFNTKSSDPEEILNQIENARKDMTAQYEKDFEPARMALIGEFRSIIDPRLKDIS
jgi:hypothetical protein